MPWIQLLIGVAFNAAANILMKSAALAAGDGGPARLLLEPRFALGVAAFVVALAAYTSALASIDLGIAYPIMTSAALVVVAIASVAIFGEPMGAPRLIGTGLVLAGVVLLAAAPGGAAAPAG